MGLKSAVPRVWFGRSYSKGEKMPSKRVCTNTLTQGESSPFSRRPELKGRVELACRSRAHCFDFLQSSF